MDLEDRVACVVFAGEESVLLQALKLVLDRSELLRELLLERRVELEELLRVLVLVLQALVAREPAAQPGVVGRDLLRSRLIVPEARSLHLRLERLAPLPDPLRVKGNHGPRRAGPRSVPVAPRAASRWPRTRGDGSRGP